MPEYLKTLDESIDYDDENEAERDEVYEDIQDENKGLVFHIINPASKIFRKKAVWRSIFLTYIALHIDYRFSKNSLLPGRLQLSDDVY